MNGGNVLIYGGVGNNKGKVYIGTTVVSEVYIGGTTSSVLGFFETTGGNTKQSVNAMTVGTMSEANDTMSNYTPSGSYLGDETAIYDNIRRLVYKLDQVVDALRAYGLI
jgi:hypothetical protein